MRRSARDGCGTWVPGGEPPSRLTAIRATEGAVDDVEQAVVRMGARPEVVPVEEGGVGDGHGPTRPQPASARRPGGRGTHGVPRSSSKVTTPTSIGNRMPRPARRSTAVWRGAPSVRCRSPPMSPMVGRSMPSSTAPAHQRPQLVVPGGDRVVRAERRGLPVGLAASDGHPAPTSLPASTTPRSNASAAARQAAPVWGRGCDVAQLAQQVDELLHVAHEVATGEVLVEDVGQLLPRRPVPRRGREPRFGRSGLGCTAARRSDRLRRSESTSSRR